LSINEILILDAVLILIQQMSELREIVLLQIDLLRETVLINLLHEIVLLSNRFIIHDIIMQAIDQIRNVD
jgi:hypothetical protein